MSAHRATTAAVALAIATVAGTAPAAAAPRLYEGVAATPVFRKTVQTDATSAPKVFATVELEPAGADTIVVVTHETGDSWANDNCDAGTLASCVTTSTAGGAYEITVFAAAANAAGTAGVELDGAAVVGAAVPFGGTILDFEAPSGDYAVHTIHVVDGADDTVLLAYDADWAPIPPGDDRSFDEAAGAVYSLSAGDRLVVGAYAPATAGCTDVVLNDCTGATPERNGTCAADADRDGLSDALEAELGTDANDRDTDGDGLFDYYEVIGRRTDDSVEALRRYGADPRRRDLFIELDRTPSASVPDAASVRGLAAVYLDIPNLTSPDGSTGIQIHADTGAPCPGLPGVCGDFGGVDVFFPDVPNNGVSKYVRNDDLVREHFSPARRGMFHYAMLTDGGGGQSGVGTTTLWAQYSDPDARYPMVYVAHEIGHSLGLQHWGADEDGRGLNYKFDYPSLMNYAFQFRIPGKTCTRSRFSEGGLPELDPMSVDEANVRPGVDKSQLMLWPAYYYFLGPDDIDFNRDTRLSDVPVVADVTPAFVAYGGTDDWPDQVGGGSIHGRVPSGGGALAVVPHDARGQHASVYAIFPFDHDGDVYPDIAVSENTVGESKTNWSGWAVGEPLPNGGGADDGEVAAALLDDDIVAIFPHADGSLWYAYVDPDTAAFEPWSPIPDWPAGARARQASAAVTDGKLAVVFRDLDGNDDVYLARLAGDGTWSAWEHLAIPSWTTPGITEGPDGNEYLAYAEPDSIDGSILFAYRPAGTTDDWTFISEETVVRQTGFDIEEQPPRARARINLVFLPYYTAADPIPEPFDDGSGTLAVYWNKGSADEDGRGAWRARRGYAEGYIDTTGPFLAPREIVWHAQTRWSPYLPHSMAVARRFIDVALAFTGLGGDANCHPTEPIYMPHSNGTPLVSDSIHSDNDDAAIIAATMCTALWEFEYGDAAECVCAEGLAVSCAARLDGPEPEWPICIDPNLEPADHLTRGPSGGHLGIEYTPRSSAQ